jgi:hypothetical protein
LSPLKKKNYGYFKKDKLVRFFTVVTCKERKPSEGNSDELCYERLKRFSFGTQMKCCWANCIMQTGNISLPLGQRHIQIFPGLLVKRREGSLFFYASEMHETKMRLQYIENLFSDSYQVGLLFLIKLSIIGL